MLHILWFPSYCLYAMLQYKFNKRCFEISVIEICVFWRPQRCDWNKITISSPGFWWRIILPSLLISIQLLDNDLGRNLTSVVLWLDWKYFLARQGKSNRAYCEWFTDLYSPQSEKVKIPFQLDLRGDCLLDTQII